MAVPRVSYEGCNIDGISVYIRTYVCVVEVYHHLLRNFPEVNSFGIK